MMSANQVTWPKNSHCFPAEAYTWCQLHPEPILPIRRIHKLCRAIYFNVARCRPFDIEISQIM